MFVRTRSFIGVEEPSRPVILDDHSSSYQESPWLLRTFVSATALAAPSSIVSTGNPASAKILRPLCIGAGQRMTSELCARRRLERLDDAQRDLIARVMRRKC